MTIEVTDENFNEILSDGKPVVLDFWAEWCGPCRMVGPIIDELASDYQGRVVIGKVNVDENNEITTQFGIRNIPTILFFKEQLVVDKQVGVAQKIKFIEKIEQLL